MASPMPNLPPGTVYGRGRYGSLQRIFMQVTAAIVHANTNDSDETSVSGMSRLPPRNGPTTVAMASTMFAVFGVPVLRSMDAKLLGR